MFAKIVNPLCIQNEENTKQIVENHSPVVLITSYNSNRITKYASHFLEVHGIKHHIRTNQLLQGQ